MPTSDSPFVADSAGGNIADVFSALSLKRCVLAVSGGSDSMAMALLAAAYQRQTGAAMLAVTVDHGLRTVSGEEAAQVGQWCKRLGLAHRTLRWDGPKPTSAIQEQARKARYRLLCQAADDFDCDHIVTAHSRDDQAETVMMRLSRGSNSVAALKAMVPQTHIAMGAGSVKTLHRPFLGVSRDELKAALQQAGHDYIRDPSNHDPAYERVRMRAMLQDMEKAGAISQDNLAAVATTMQQEATRMKAVQDRQWSHMGGYFNRFGAAICDGRHGQLPASMTPALLGRIVHAVGGQQYGPGPEQLAQLFDALSSTPTARALAGCMIHPVAEKIYFYREGAALAGRAGVPPIPELVLEPGKSIVWDGRFCIRNNGAMQWRVMANPQIGTHRGALKGVSQIDVGQHAYPFMVPASDGDADYTVPGAVMPHKLNLKNNGLDVSSLILERFYTPVVRF